MTYQEFLETKRHSVIDYGIKPIFIPENRFDFQKYVTEYLCKKGRAACFLDTGLGKTIIELYSNVGEVVLTPFMGVGSEIYSPVSMGRKAIGIELKETYFKQAVMNLKDVKNRFQTDTQQKLF